MATSTLGTLLSNTIATFWDYITVVFTPVVTFGIAFALVAGIIWLVWRRSHFTNK